MAASVADDFQLIDSYMGVKEAVQAVIKRILSRGRKEVNTQGQITQKSKGRSLPSISPVDRNDRITGRRHSTETLGSPLHWLLH